MMLFRNAYKLTFGMLVDFVLLSFMKPDVCKTLKINQKKPE